MRGVWASEGGWGCDCGVEAEVDGGGASVGRAEVTPRLWSLSVTCYGDGDGDCGGGEVEQKQVGVTVDVYCTSTAKRP